ncbi:putative Protein YgiW [Hollandina sp. SP2]
MNRKWYGYVLFVWVCTGSILNAQEGYRGPGPTMVTVEVVKTLKDDYLVTVQGKIEQFLGHEKYLFTDDTGSIVIEIDKKLWRGISVDQEDIVEITGEVDRESEGVEIEAKTIKKR